MVNQLDLTTRFELDQLKAEEYAALRDLEVGDITDPFESMDEDRRKLYKIIMIRSQSEPHRANLRDDYMTLMSMALEEKKNKIFMDWLDEKMSDTFISVDEAFTGCQFSRKGWIKN